MYCPACGFEYTQKTNYCKRCGEDLSPSGITDAPNKTRPNVTGMFWGVIAFCLTAMMLLMLAFDYFSSKNRDRCNGLCNDDKDLLSFVAFFTFVVALLLIWQLARMVTAYRRTGQNVTVEKHFIREVPAIQSVAPTGQITGTVEPPSVVETTTRQMASVYVEPKAVK